MAVLKNNYFGSPSGRIGNLVYTIRYGKTYISRRPRKSVIPPTERCIMNRKKFGVFAGLCKAMNSIFIINTLWKRARLPGHSNSNKQSKVNFRLFTGVSDISFIKLFPAEANFSAGAVSAIITDNILKITLQLTTGLAQISELIYPEISLHGIIKLSDDAAEDPKPVCFLPLSSAGIIFRKNVPLEFLVPLMGDDYRLFQQYPLHNLTAALVIKNKSGEACYFSDNINTVISI